MRITTVVLAMCSLVMIAVVGCDRDSQTVSGRGGKELKLESPGDATIERGQTKEIEISIERENLPGEVSVEFSNLPEGVTVVDGDRKMTGDKQTYLLRANDSAAMVGNHEAKVTAKADKENVSVSQTFRITVKEASE